MGVPDEDWKKSPLLRLRSHAEDCETAAWIIDPFEAKIVGMNAAAATDFAQYADQGSRELVIDAAMPAVTTLRSMTQHGPSPRGEPFRCVLVFWTPRGAVRRTCDVIVQDDAAQYLCHVWAVASGTPSADDSSLTQVSRARDDAEILREIAERIRGGVRESTLTIGVHSNCPDLSKFTNDNARSPDHLPADPLLPLISATSRSNEAQPGAPKLPRPRKRGEAAEKSETSELNTLQVRNLAHLAHELKTPLAAIAAAADIMRAERFGLIDNRRYRSYVRDILECARHALAVIDRVIDQSYPAGQQSGRYMADIDLNALAENCVTCMRPIAEQKSLTLVFRPARQGAELAADATALHRILLNLLTNSVKFTPAGGTITVTVRSSAGAATCIEIVDTGIGMSKSEIARFLKRRNLASTARRKGGGLGIGLALTRELADANGAVLEIASSKKTGTKVTLSFSLCRRAAL